MSQRIVEEGHAFGGWTEFKAFLTDETPLIFFEDDGTMLTVAAHKDTARTYWCTMDASDIADFHATFDSIGYDMRAA